MKLLVILEDLSPFEQLSNLLTLLFTEASVDATVLAVIPEDSQEEKLADVDKLLSDMVNALPSSLAHRKIRQGKYIDQVLKELDQGSYDLAVIQRGKPHLPGTFPSTARYIKIVDKATCSLLVLPAGPTPGNTPERLLICDSGSERTSAIYDFLNQFLSPVSEGLEITVLHVMSQISASPGVPGKELRSEAEDLIKDQTLEGRLLERDIKLLQDSGFNAQPKIRHGLVVDEISSEAKEGDYDLVVIGAHPRGLGQAVLLENIAKKILLALDRSVLVVSAEAGLSSQQPSNNHGGRT